MNLCIDIGNTKSKMGIFENDRLVKTKSAKNITLRLLNEMIESYQIRYAIVSNTRDYYPEIKTRLSMLDFFEEINEHTLLPFTNNYSTPQTLGKDRIAAVCGAQSIYPNEHVLVIDAGTCITMDLITKEKKYFGGSIHPGITMRFKALNNYTGKLPLVKKQKFDDLIGDSTENSILAGVSFAAIKEIEGMIDEYKVKFGELKVIITGGDASFFVSQLKSKIFAHSNLVLSGLNKILKYNVEKL